MCRVETSLERVRVGGPVTEGTGMSQAQGWAVDTCRGMQRGLDCSRVGKVAGDAVASTGVATHLPVEAAA